MTIFDALNLLGGLALFLFGMNIMGQALEKRAGNRLKTVIASMTSSPLKGFLLGLGVTAVIQSSSATTVMVVGFVNSGIMKLSQAIGVIFGANLGTSVTSWLLSTTGIDGDSFFIKLLKPSSFTPILAFIGIILYMFQKNAKKKDIGLVMIGFAVLMFGMETMSGAVSGLENVPEFTKVLTLFKNPVLGVLAGTVFTAVIQSSSASVGILQALTVTGSITYSAAIPIIMGQNIGTCVSAMISSIGASKNAKRAAVVHLSFNIIGTLILLPVYYLVNSFAQFGFTEQAANPLGIAVVHTVFKLLALAILMPCTKLLEKLACFIVKDSKESEETQLLDERLLATPSVAIGRSKTVAVTMAELSVKSLYEALGTLTDTYNEKLAEKIREDEDKVDLFEDKIGSYLVKVAMRDISQSDSTDVTRLLHLIGDFERISDHAVNILESAEEMHDKQLCFSPDAKRELEVMISAVKEALALALAAFRDDDLDSAFKVEPLEQVVDYLRDSLKKLHIARLQRQECTIELGFVLTDVLTNLERISDHCSNIAGCMLELAHDGMDIHEYLRGVKGGDTKAFNDYYDDFKKQYALPVK